MAVAVDQVTDHACGRGAGARGPLQVHRVLANRRGAQRQRGSFGRQVDPQVRFVNVVAAVVHFVYQDVAIHPETDGLIAGEARGIHAQADDG